jgi:hypothetical protein
VFVAIRFFGGSPILAKARSTGAPFQSASIRILQSFSVVRPCVTVACNPLSLIFLFLFLFLSLFLFIMIIQLPAP